jgi:hypothetical protein
MSLYGMCLLFSLLWTMCFVAILIEIDSLHSFPYQFYEPESTSFQKKDIYTNIESPSINCNLIVSEEDIIPKNTFLHHTLQNERKIRVSVSEEENHNVHHELHTLHRQLRMNYRKLFLLEQKYNHMEMEKKTGQTETEEKEKTEKSKEIKKQYQDVRESYLYTKKRLDQLKNSIKT